MNPSDLLMFAIAAVVPIFLGYSFTVALLPAHLSRRVAWALAPGVGLGVCSLLMFMFRRPIFTVEAMITLVVLASWLWRGSWLTRLRSTGALVLWRPPALCLALVAGLGMAMAGMMIQVHRQPHAAWDGWAIWNTHARLIYRDGPHWQSKLQYTFHGDYPEFTPMVTARFWRHAGHEVPEAGAFVGILLALSTIGLLGVTLAEFRSSAPAFLLPLTLAATPSYLEHASNQYADIPLGFFVLGTIALICLHSELEPNNRRTLVLAGFMAGCAGWTKNEGLLFILAACVALLAPAIHNRSAITKRFTPFLAGLILPLAVIVVFKLTIAPQNDLMRNQSFGLVIQRLFDAVRHRTILAGFARQFLAFGGWSLSPFVPLLGLVLARGIDRSRLRSLGWLTGIAIVVLVVGGYYVVYLNTPIPLQRHIDTSLDRLLLHVWPSFLLLAGISLGTRGGIGDKEAQKSQNAL